MPVRQATQGGLQTPQLAGYQSAGVAAPTYQQPQAKPDGSAFWNGLLGGALQQGVQEMQQAAARGYLEGQQDSLEGRAKAERGFLTRELYEQGYNKATVSTSLANFQLGLQNKATEYVNSGRSPEDFNAYVSEETNKLLTEAGSSGMDLNDKDWQAWLGSVEGSRNTAAEYFQAQHLKRSDFMREQGIAAEGNAAIATFVAADQAGDPMQAMENVNSHVTRINNDDTLSPQQKVSYTSQFLVDAYSAASSTGGVTGLSSYMESLPEYKNMPTEMQTQLRNMAQNQYEKRASDESVKLYEYNSQVASVADYNQLVKDYPMGQYISTVMGAVHTKNIAPSTGYAMVDAEAVRRAKLQKAATGTMAYTNGITTSDIATATGEGLDKVKTNLVKLYSSQYGGYSAGGLNLMQRGLRSGAQDIASVGIEMMQQDAQGLANVDWRNLQKDSDGNPLYPSSVVTSLGNLRAAYNASIAAGNQVQANALLSGLPDAVSYGIRQGGDERDLASVVGKRANDIAAGNIVQLPAQMPNSLLLNQDDVLAGMLDFGITQGARNRNLLGIQSWVFTSSADEKAAQARMNQLNGALNAEYTKRQQAGTLPALNGDDLKNWLIGKVGSRAVQVKDGTDAGSMLILPDVGNKTAVFGTEDNTTIARALQEDITDFRKQYPAAVTVQMDYDPLTQEVIFQSTNAENQLGTTATAIPSSALRDRVRGVQNIITNSGRGAATGNLSVPGAGFVQYNTQNQYGVAPNTMMDAVGRLVGYEGYTNNKGFSILATHPTTGKALNEQRYVKQPQDSPQVAADKLSMYVNDKVMPSVMQVMPTYDKLPGFLKTEVFNTLVETTYHAGTADAFNKYMTMALAGDLAGAINGFQESPLYKDAGGADVKRNRDRLSMLRQLTQYSALGQVTQ